MINCILASTSTIHNSSYLEYLFNELKELFRNTDEVLFIPYARPSGISHEEYTTIAKKGFQKINKKLIGVHTFDDPIKAINNAKGIFTGGGNTFVLVAKLYELQLINPLRKKILEGTPYLGTSAGSNIAGVSMKTTNDMPIVYPPSFTTLHITPFNINAHYLDPDPKSTHKGETRETRIKEFHQFNKTPVIGLREGSWIRLKNNQCILEGKELSARIFEQNKEPVEVPPNTSLLYLK
ncbi:dipeptidase E [Maribacter vaceletii]|uniref:Dipeptidase E n=1 Tax=Maribacter vaceletii TaxID=1206816 RepID=A0A495DT52_9FLAO|nr:dipeptidase PepE [Maribacter vaceletii]RKR07740.1 dipeptidase E [Maribacter vaceletii]